MATPPPRRSPGAPPFDELEALLEIDRGMDDIFNDIHNPTENASNDKRAFKEVTYGSSSKVEVFGADDEIKLGSKKRKPVAKLDEARIPKEELSLTVDNPQFSDVVHLLRMYQLWLDDLYPRAKFVDGLAIIEKLGHSKRMQVRRKGWIAEGKPQPVGDADDARLDMGPPADTGHRELLHGADGVVLADRRLPGSVSRPEAGENENGLDLMRNREPVPAGADPSRRTDGPGEPDPDELDALLAAALGNTNEIAPDKAVAHRPSSAVEQSFDDDEDAMRELAGIDDRW